MVEESFEEDMPIRSTTTPWGSIQNEREYTDASLNLETKGSGNQDRESRSHLQFYMLHQMSNS